MAYQIMKGERNPYNPIQLRTKVFEKGVCQQRRWKTAVIPFEKIAS
jgi:hypothetical protein